MVASWNFQDGSRKTFEEMTIMTAAATGENHDLTKEIDNPGSDLVLNQDTGVTKGVAIGEMAVKITDRSRTQML
jgi:hypothetical protein